MRVGGEGGSEDEDFGRKRFTKEDSYDQEDDFLAPSDEEEVVEDDEDEDDFFEVECPNCQEPLIIDDEALAAGEVECPNCEQRFSLELTDEGGDEEES